MQVLNEHEAMAWPAPCRRAPVVGPVVVDPLGFNTYPPAPAPRRPPIVGAPRWSTGLVVPDDQLTDFERESLKIARDANPMATVRPMVDDRGVFYLRGEFPAAAFGRGAVTWSNMTVDP